MCIAYDVEEEEEVGFWKVFVVQFQSPVPGCVGHKIALDGATPGRQRSAYGGQLQDVFGN